MADKGVIVWRGDFGNPESHYAKSVITGVTDDAALSTLITALLAYSDCNAAKRSLLTTTKMTDAVPVADANVDYRGVVYMQDTDLSIHKIEIPAMVSTAVEDTPQGERVTAAALAAIVAAINTATGKTYTGLYGKVIQKT